MLGWPRSINGWGRKGSASGHTNSQAFRIEATKINNTVCIGEVSKALEVLILSWDAAVAVLTALQESHLRVVFYISIPV